MNGGLSDETLVDGLVTAEGGVGPLLQRDYWAVIDACRLSPAEVKDFALGHFCGLAPDELARFETASECEGELEAGDELAVRIAGAGTFRVRLVHHDEQSFTLATVRGHPEAGRITFGAYRNPYGDVIFHIRSVARSSSRVSLVGFLLVGEAMQTTTWTDFVDRVARSTGDGVVGSVHAQTRRVEDCDDDDSCVPTFVARGG